MGERYGATMCKVNVSYQKVLTKSKCNEGGECASISSEGLGKVKYVCGEKLHCLSLKKEKEISYTELVISR